jgi:hypothetical protein
MLSRRAAIIGVASSVAAPAIVRAQDQLIVVMTSYYG